jgi:hypothetical protein
VGAHLYCADCRDESAPAASTYRRPKRRVNINDEFSPKKQDLYLAFSLAPRSDDSPCILKLKHCLCLTIDITKKWPQHLDVVAE